MSVRIPASTRFNLAEVKVVRRKFSEINPDAQVEWKCETNGDVLLVTSPLENLLFKIEKVGSMFRLSARNGDVVGEEESLSTLLSAV